MKNSFAIAAAAFALACIALSSQAESISYELTKPSRVSINIMDAEGRIVRELLHAEPRAAGAWAEEWDGLAEDGSPLPAGEYSWKLLATPGLKATYLMSLGTNYPVDPEDWRNRAPGTHGGPSAVAIDETGIFVAASCTENIENYLLKMDRNGEKRIWSVCQHVPWKGGKAMAVDGDKLYVLATSGDIWVYNSSNGKLLSTLKPRVGEDVPADIDARDGRIAACFAVSNVVAWLNAESGELGESVELSLPNAVALDGPQSLVVLSSNRLCRVVSGMGNPADVSVLADGLVDPRRVAVDPVSGDILVAEGGDSKQVVRFSRDGKRGKAFGRKGGRRDGLYEPCDFGTICDLTSDGAGGFLVAEANDAPRRVAWLDRKGRLINEWYGGQPWASWAIVEPDNPSAVWMQSGWGSMTRLIVDLKKKSFRVHSVYRYVGLADGMQSGHQNASVWESRMHDGELYLVHAGEAVVRVDRKHWRLVPATIHYKHIQHYRDHFPCKVLELANGGNVLQWNDLNGDGLPQPESEVNVNAADTLWTGLPYVDDNFNEMFCDSGAIYETPVVSWTKCGAPVYSNLNDPIVRIPAKSHPRINAIEPRWSAFLQRDPTDGSLYAAINDRILDWGKSADSCLVKWDADGKELWTVGRQGEDDGQIWRPFRRFVGLAHGCPVVTGFSYEYPTDGATATYVWDRDGLWVGSVFDEIDLDAAPENLYSFGAEALHAVMVEEKSGDMLLYGCWLNETRVYRITGWDGWERMSGSVELASSHETADVAETSDKEQNATEELAPDVGLVGRYYDASKPADDRLVLERIDTTIDFHWGVYEPGHSPLPELQKGQYSVRWTGYVTAPEDGLYAFRSNGSCSVGRVSIGGRDFHAPYHDREHRANYRVMLKGGERTPIEIVYATEMTHPVTDHGITLQWLPPRTHRWSKVPASALSH